MCGPTAFTCRDTGRLRQGDGTARFDLQQTFTRITPGRPVAPRVVDLHRICIELADNGLDLRVLLSFLETPRVAISASVRPVQHDLYSDPSAPSTAIKGNRTIVPRLRDAITPASKVPTR
jgi:hypothetical protein